MPFTADAVRQGALNTSGAIAPDAAHMLPREETLEWMARTLIDFFA
jgi:hypothetical protein